MKKTMLSLVLALSLLIGCIPCFAEGNSDNVLHVYTDRVFRSFNQVTASDGNFFDVAGSFSEGLLRLDADGNAQPALAESYTLSDDGLTYTFTLRDGITWSDGTPITAHDFEFAWITEISDADNNGYATTIAPFLKNGEAYMNGECDASEVGVKALDDKTFEVVLNAPAPFFARMTGLAFLFPLNEEFYTSMGDRYATSADTIMCCGPFVITSMDVSVGVTMVKNESYWDAENVKLDGLEVKVITDSSAALNAYEAGEIDRVNLSSTDVMLYMGDPEFGSYNDFRNYYLQFDYTNERLNAKMRQALSLAIDRDTLVNQVLMTGAVAAGGVVSQGINGDGTSSFRELEGPLSYYDPDLAKQLWAEGVEEMGSAPENLVLLTAEGTDFDDVAVFIQDQFRTVLGLEVTINSMTQKARNEVMNNDAYFDMALSAWGADYDDPMTYLELWTTGTGYRGHYDRPEYLELISKIRSEADSAVRLQYMLDAEKMLVGDDCVVSGIYDRGYSYLQRDYVKGYITHSVGQSNEYKWVSLEK